MQFSLVLPHIFRIHSYLRLLYDLSMDFIFTYLHTCVIIRMIRPDLDQTHFFRHYPIVLNLDSAKCVHIKQFEQMLISFCFLYYQNIYPYQA